MWLFCEMYQLHASTELGLHTCCRNTNVPSHSQGRANNFAECSITITGVDGCKCVVVPHVLYSFTEIVC